MNEQVLKDEEYDTYSDKNAITNGIVTIDQNRNILRSDIEDMVQIAEDTEDLEELLAILDLLI